MIAKLDTVGADIVGAGDVGLTLGQIRKKFVGKSGTKAKAREAEMRERLASLVREGAIRGPFKTGASQLYFAAGRGPSIETASDTVAEFVFQSGVKLLSKAALEKKITGLNRRFFADAIADAVAKQTIMELVQGRARFYLHRDVAAERFGFEVEGPTAPKKPALTFADLSPVYRRLKAEQGGFPAVKIFELIRALKAPKAEVHRLLIEEANAGRVTIHPTTSVELPPEVIDAGVRLPGFAEPFITVVVKDDR
jgi:hypothetical protein